jgi:hypothetical protein
MSSSCCWGWVGVVGFAGVEEVFVDGDLGVAVVVVVVFSFVGVAVLESSSLSESESESHVRSSVVVCAAPVLGCC